MVQYTDELKEEIRSANDIVDVISQYVTLKRSGRNFFGLCPFHKEKSPSFSVSADRQYFHCFGCHKGGDVFTFISEIERISFKESLEFLAERARIELPTVENSEFNKTQYLKDRMFKINAETAIFYHERLYKPLAKIAQDYVKQRKLDNNTLKAFKIGYSGEYNELYKMLKSKGFKDEEILATGLVNKTERGEFIDRFRKRLMFPIMDVSGRVIAFGGRKLENNDKMAKYINSNENLVYSKKKHLFALNLAKQSDSKQIILVEGYMDAISLYQRGFNNVVASLGTALTEEQGRLLRKYSEQVILSYDSDGAGQEAIMRGLSILENQGCDARVLQMEGAKDPDEYVIKYGSGRFKLLIENAISLVEFKIKMVKSKYNLENANDKIRFLKEITKILSNVDNKIEREIYIESIAGNYNISKEAIYAEVNKAAYNNNTKFNEKNLVKPAVKQEKVIEISPAIIKRENMILYLLINHFRESYEAIVTNISLDDFKLETNKFIFEKILESPAEESEKILQTIANIEDAEIQSHVSEILVTDYEISSIEKCIEDVVNIYNKDRLANRKLEIVKELENSSNLTKDEIAKLEQELSEIIIELAKRK
ncbi:MAG: DNA primase [Clostridia bacterium]|nr:DNA primase [Clostridia bacterium]